MDAIKRDMLAGDLDFTSVLSRHAVHDMEGVRKLLSPGSSTALLWLNADRLDLGTRRAIACAIDRYQLAATSLSEGYKVQLEPEIASVGHG